MLCCIYAVCKVRWGAAAALDGHIHQGNTFVSLQHNEAVPQPTHDCPNHCYHVRNSIAASVLQVHGLENVSFRCIIAAYRRQPQAKPDTYNSGGSGAAGCTCAVLCCAVLCCAVLCCAVLCCAVMCCAMLCWIAVASAGPASSVHESVPYVSSSAAGSSTLHSTLHLRTPRVLQ